MTPPPPREFPYWLVLAGAVGVYLFYRIWSDDLYAQVLATVSRGIGITVFVALVAFSLASVLGLALALASTSRFVAVRQLARLYVELVRGIPIIVLLLYVAFVGAPGIVWLLNALLAPFGVPDIRTRDMSLLWRAVFALTMAYSAFLSEIFRAGLQSVSPGQIEASQALGLSRWHRFRHIVFPQAFRTILPPFGNDFVAMVKDSSLVSVLGVADITQLGKVAAAGNFRYFETYNVVALIYLTMTITLSLALRRLEARLRLDAPK